MDRSADSSVNRLDGYSGIGFSIDPKFDLGRAKSGFRELFFSLCYRKSGKIVFSDVG